MKMFILFLVSMFTSCYAGEIFHNQDKIYIDPHAFKANEIGDAFYLHAGENVWLSTNAIHRDHSGMYSYEYDLLKCVGKNYELEYEKKWKCPYCNMYWKIGQKCQNDDCPSKYKRF
jgi:hypothetical protein